MEQKKEVSELFASGGGRGAAAMETREYCLFARDLRALAQILRQPVARAQAHNGVAQPNFMPNRQLADV